MKKKTKRRAVLALMLVSIFYSSASSISAREREKIVSVMTEKELNGWSTWAKNVADTTFGNNTTDSAEFYGSLYSDSDGVAT